ncbi:hypothetical protein CLV83_3074 [Marinobacterium mangrovicola]|uniref:Uncharacterized protein n=2 Tax=Marinobacterium mangrovicola TaxID=1476959 RepID=A0A4R1GHC6_9GAMM|nr:hypothetical protein CLV83_3074 [Marinobacterium mangrovicola]
MHILIVVLVVILLLAISPTLRKLSLGAAVVFVVATFAVFIILSVDSSRGSILWVLGIFGVAALAILSLLIVCGINLLGVVFGSGAEYVDQRSKGKKPEEALRSAGGKALELLAEDAISEDDRNRSLETSDASRQNEQVKPPIQPEVTHNFPHSCCIQCRNEVIVFVSVTGDLLALDQLSYPWAIHTCFHDTHVQKGTLTAQAESWAPFEVHSYGREIMRGRSGREASVSMRILTAYYGPWSRYWHGEPVFVGTLPNDCYRIVTICNLSGELVQPDIIARYLPSQKCQ